MNFDFDINAMRERLNKARIEKGLSYRKMSDNAGTISKGYVHAVLVDGVEPTISKLAAICQGNDISLSYVLFGFEMSAETERLLSLMEQDADRRDSILKLMDRSE